MIKPVLTAFLTNLRAIYIIKTSCSQVKPVPTVFLTNLRAIYIIKTSCSQVKPVLNWLALVDGGGCKTH